jgi:hypothetical protein
MAIRAVTPKTTRSRALRLVWAFSSIGTSSAGCGITSGEGDAKALFFLSVPEVVTIIGV